MFRFRTTKQVLFECEARVHLLYLKRLQLISERSTGRELLCGTFLSAQESTVYNRMKLKYNLRTTKNFLALRDVSSNRRRMSRVRLYAVWLRVEFLNERSEFRNSGEG